MKVNYYNILNIPPHASDDDVRRAYRARALLYHPDRNPGNARAARAFVLINKAYDMLKTGPQRAAYNRKLARAARERQTRENKKTGFFSGVVEILWPFGAGVSGHG